MESFVRRPIRSRDKKAEWKRMNTPWRYWTSWCVKSGTQDTFPQAPPVGMCRIRPGLRPLRPPVSVLFMTKTEAAPAAVTDEFRSSRARSAYDSVSRDVTRNSQALSEGNVTAVQFTYYPQQTSSTAPAPYCFSTGTPAGCSGNLASSLSSVQKILISVTVQSKNPDVQFGGQSSITMSSSADLRNHGLPS